MKIPIKERLRTLYWRWLAWKSYAIDVAALVAGERRLYRLRKLRIERRQALVAFCPVTTVRESGGYVQWKKDNAKRLAWRDALIESTNSMMRIKDPGWVKIGITDSADRRSTWARLDSEHGTIELCAGREGDDEYVVISSTNPAFTALWELVGCSIWIAEGCQ